MNSNFTLQNLNTRFQLSFSNCKNCYIIYEKICQIEKYDKISYSTFKRRVYKKPFRFLHFEVVKCNLVKTKEMKCVDIRDIL
jgi:hypothetical protein